MTNGEHETPSHGFLKGSVYDILKFIALIALPALGTLYFSLAGIWDLPKAEEVVGTIVVIDTFLGGLIGLSKSSYDKSDARFDGVMHVGPDKNSLVLNDDVEALEKKKELVFKVNTPE